MDFSYNSGTFQDAASALVLGAGEFVHEPFKGRVSVSHRPPALLDGNPLPSKPDVVGACLPGVNPLS